MSRINCNDGPNASAVPCRCDPVTGCGHASSWHRVAERWLARCMVPACACPGMEVCDCCESAGASETDDAKVLAALGIAS